jgi:hypothetical protein
LGFFVAACAPPPATNPAAATPRAAAHDSREVGRPISGVVLDTASGFPNSGLQVLVGRERTTTDGDGNFTLGALPEIYDLVLVNGERSMVHTYRQLRRGDLVLTFPEHRLW